MIHGIGSHYLWTTGQTVAAEHPLGTFFFVTDDVRLYVIVDVSDCKIWAITVSLFDGLGKPELVTCGRLKVPVHQKRYREWFYADLWKEICREYPNVSN